MTDFFLNFDFCDDSQLKESDYFDENVEMHYALLQSAEKVGPNLHTHDFFEIFLITEGQIKHIVNGRTLLLLPGSMTLIRPDDAHYYRPSNGHDCQVINLAVARRAVLICLPIWVMAFARHPF